MILSVIVPVFNTEKYLEQCINSILNQTLQDIEVILVDDGSTDQSPFICDKYAEMDGRVKVLHQENKGPIQARKIGVELSNASYITFVDSDDFIEKEAYIYALDSIKREIDVICFGITRYYGTKETLKVEYLPFLEETYQRVDLEKEIIPKMIWREEEKNFGIDPSLCTKIIKKELLVKSYLLLQELNFHYGEDPAVIYPVISMSNSMEIKHYSYYYHRQKGSGEYATYIKDKDFLDKLYMVYYYLKNYFLDNRELVKQVEQFFMYSVNLKRREYGEYYQEITFLFPFDKIDKKQKIVLYGAGVMGKSYYYQLLKIPYCDLVLWVDKNYQKYKNYKVEPIEAIYNIQYDRVVIAINNMDVCKKVKNYLIEQGVEEYKIILP